jgi:hypothetical protein
MPTFDDAPMHTVSDGQSYSYSIPKLRSYLLFVVTINFFRYILNSSNK